MTTIGPEGNRPGIEQARASRLAGINLPKSIRDIRDTGNQASRKPDRDGFGVLREGAKALAMKAQTGVPNLGTIAFGDTASLVSLGVITQGAVRASQQETQRAKNTVRNDASGTLRLANLFAAAANQDRLAA